MYIYIMNIFFYMILIIVHIHNMLWIDPCTKPLRWRFYASSVLTTCVVLLYQPMRLKCIVVVSRHLCMQRNEKYMNLHVGSLPISWKIFGWWAWFKTHWKQGLSSALTQCVINATRKRSCFLAPFSSLEFWQLGGNVCMQPVGKFDSLRLWETSG